MRTERRLRIALLAHSTNPRGGVVHALELGEALHAAGHHVAIHAPDASGRGFFRHTRCDAVSIPARPVSGGLAEFVGQRIDDYVDHFTRAGTDQWDILHAQDAISANALVTLRERGLVDNFLRTVHHLDTFADPRIIAWQKRGFASATRVLCVSRTWQDILAQIHGVAAEQVSNGVDTQRFSARADASDAQVRARYGLDPVGPVLLAVGGVEERKNTLRLFQAFLEVRRNLPQAQLVIAGGASLLDHESYRARFDSAVRAGGLATGPGQPLVLAGPVADEDMPALFRSADALVFPSVKEGFGLVVLEAMASGVPVVVSRIAPFIEYLRDGDCAWADPFSAGSIARAIVGVCKPAIAGALRRAGRAVCENFTWAASAGRHLEIYADFPADAGSVPSPAEHVHA
ncbi:MAG: MSMEG_0565 family glycosyltransferase [Betaproteobacteria bacterium]|nr:MSMEG_0565 family glycosyltransferase [Betaproteobacteria bacterium]